MVGGLSRRESSFRQCGEGGALESTQESWRYPSSVTARWPNRVLQRSLWSEQIIGIAWVDVLGEVAGREGDEGQACLILNHLHPLAIDHGARTFVLIREGTQHAE